MALQHLQQKTPPLVQERKCRRLMLLPVATCILRSLCRHQSQTCLEICKGHFKREETHHKRGDNLTTRRSCHELLSLTVFSVKSRKQPAIEEISARKKHKPQHGNPAFPCSVGNEFHYVNVRHFWSVAQRRQFHSINMATGRSFRRWVHS